MTSLKIKHIVLAAMALTASAMSQAQTTAPTTAASGVKASTVVQRNVNQEKRIEQGLQSGSLNTREAAQLQKEESKVDRLEAQSLKDGKLTPEEKLRVTQAQNKVSQDIRTDKTNAVKGNPTSVSSQRLQADVQRNVNQQERVEQGLQSGSVTQHEAARLERGQARVEHREAVAGQDGHVGAREQRRIHRAEDRQSRRIYRQKHDAQHQGV
jgi:hypothetical protein